MDHPTSNTAQKKPRAAYAMRGLVLLLVLAGTLGAIYVLARLAPPKVQPEDMIVAPQGDDARGHGLTMSEEQAGKTGREAPTSSGMQGMYTKPQAGAGSETVANPAHHYSDLPGLDMTLLPEHVHADILARANHEKCTCDCGMTIAQCRNEDPNCRHSLQRAAAIYADLVGQAIDRGEIVEK